MSDTETTTRASRKTRDGIVTSDAMDKTVVVAVEDRFKHPLYGKVVRRTCKLNAHDEANACGIGDRVLLMETRPLSATKRWRVVEILEKAKDLGLTHLVVPYLENKHRNDLDGYKATAEKLNAAAVESQKAGIQLAYHNHAFEFKPMAGGKSGFDVFIEEFAPEIELPSFFH